MGGWGGVNRVSVRSRRAAGAANTGGALVAWVHRVVIFVGGGDASEHSVCNICLSSIDLNAMNGAVGDERMRASATVD